MNRLSSGLERSDTNEVPRPAVRSPWSTAPRRSARLRRSGDFQRSGSRVRSLPVVRPDKPGLQNHNHCSGLYKDSFRPFEPLWGYLIVELFLVWCTKVVYLGFSDI